MPNYKKNRELNYHIYYFLSIKRPNNEDIEYLMVFVIINNMILYINTTDGEKVALALGKAGKLVAKREFKAKYKQSELLLPAIDLLLQKAKVKPKDLDGIVVVKGPGPFTATRIGVTVANALGYALEIPIVGIKNLPCEIKPRAISRGKELQITSELIMEGYEKLRKMKNKKGIMAVEPVYDKGPNITIKN